MKDYLPTQENISKHDLLKKEVKRCIKRSKHNHHRTKIEENAANPQKLWNVIKNIAPSSVKQKSQNEKSSLKADQLASHFATIGKSVIGRSNSISTSDFKYENTSTFSIKPCKEEDIKKIVDRMPMNKATGTDGLPMKAIKFGIDYHQTNGKAN